MENSVKDLLLFLNEEYCKRHTTYENLFWAHYMDMNDSSVEADFEKASKDKDSFCADSDLYKRVQKAMEYANLEEKEKLLAWIRFFDCYQVASLELLELKEKIIAIETKIKKKVADYEYGYIDPKTGNFISASELEMSEMKSVSDDESIRKACFDALEKFSVVALDEYVERVKLLNEFARAQGFEDYYAYVLQVKEGMTKSELFQIFDDVYEKTLHVFEKVRKMEETKPGLRKPWNYGYMMSGDFTKEDDPYYPFDEALIRWGRSFAACGINYRGGILTLDLLDRKGKHNNGFCHQPVLVHYKNGQRNSGKVNFTSTVVYGQVGSAETGYLTLFHEGGHAAAFLNTDQKEVCFNHEYAPLSSAWAETQSMFLDSMFSSMPWASRYAKNKEGETYPFELFQKQVERLSFEWPHGLHDMMAVCSFERAIYEDKNLTKERVMEIAREMSDKFFDLSESTLWFLRVSHIYSLDSTCIYHGYALAELALCQWEKYFINKYGYIVDNPKVGEEMTALWKLGSSKTFPEFVVLATGKKLSAKDWLDSMNESIEETLENTRKAIERLKTVPEHSGPIDLDARIVMASGKEIICDNSVSFEDMAEKYAAWLETQKKSED